MRTQKSHWGSTRLVVLINYNNTLNLALIVKFFNLQLSYLNDNWNTLTKSDNFTFIQISRQESLSASLEIFNFEGRNEMAQSLKKM